MSKVGGSGRTAWEGEREGGLGNVIGGQSWSPSPGLWPPRIIGGRTYAVVGEQTKEARRMGIKRYRRMSDLLEWDI